MGRMGATVRRCCALLGVWNRSTGRQTCPSVPEASPESWWCGGWRRAPRPAASRYATARRELAGWRGPSVYEYDNEWARRPEGPGLMCHYSPSIISVEFGFGSIHQCMDRSSLNDPTPFSFLFFFFERWVTPTFLTFLSSGQAYRVIVLRFLLPCFTCKQN